MGRRVLVTGVSGYWGGELARRLERNDEIEYIAGLDSRPPSTALARTEFIRADIRNPLISKLLPETAVDTVVHCDVLLAPEPGKGPEQLHDINVIGSLQLLAACEKTKELRSIIVRGSAAIYGAEPNAPSFFTEDMARRFPLRTRFQRDVGELENYFENYARRYPDATVMTLRFQPSLGATLDSPLTRYLRKPVVPVQLGFDPLLQVVHADDAVGALEAAVRNPVRGPVNVAGEGSISLMRLLRLAGRVPLPVPAPLFGPTIGLGRRLGFPRLPPEVVPWLRNGVTLDCRRLIEEVGFRPRSTLETVGEFVERISGRSVREGIGKPIPDPATASGGGRRSRIFRGESRRSPSRVGRSA
jgi:UDP-glucose 4-epimerase